MRALVQSLSDSITCTDPVGISTPSINCDTFAQPVTSLLHTTQRHLSSRSTSNFEIFKSFSRVGDTRHWKTALRKRKILSFSLMLFQLQKPKALVPQAQQSVHLSLKLFLQLLSLIKVSHCSIHAKFSLGEWLTPFSPTPFA